MSAKTLGHQSPSHTSNTEARKVTAIKVAPITHQVSEEERSRLIEVRAYDLWEKAGKPDGDEMREQLWCTAEKEILASRK
jgi:hypothetical protein